MILLTYKMLDDSLSEEGYIRMEDGKVKTSFTNAFTRDNLTSLFWKGGEITPEAGEEYIRALVAYVKGSKFYVLRPEKGEKIPDV